MPSTTQKSSYNGTTYAEADKYLKSIVGKRGEVGAGKIANNTYIERLGSATIGIRLHRTYIVSYTVGGMIVLHTGGWYSPVTARRINQFTRIKLSLTEKSQTLYYRASGPGNVFDWDNPIVFHDGMQVAEDGYRDERAADRAPEVSYAYVTRLISDMQ